MSNSIKCTSPFTSEIAIKKRKTYFNLTARKCMPGMFQNTALGELT